MQLLILATAVMITLGAALAAAAGILSLMFRLMSRASLASSDAASEELLPPALCAPDSPPQPGQARPAITSAFVRASLEAWEYAFEHPDETVDIVLSRMREARLPANRVHQRWMLDRMSDLMQTPSSDTKRGQLVPADYLAVGESMKREKLISAYPMFEDFHWSADARDR